MGGSMKENAEMLRQAEKRPECGYSRTLPGERAIGRVSSAASSAGQANARNRRTTSFWTVTRTVSEPPRGGMLHSRL